MIIQTLLKREWKANLKILLIFLAVITLYGGVIVAMFDPKLGESLNLMAESMPQLFDAFGMSNPGATLLEFVGNYLYGFILLVIPLICIVLLCNRVIVRYVDRGSMAYLLATPNKRVKVITTQALFLILSILLLVIYTYALVLISGIIFFHETVDPVRFLILNLGLSALLLFFAGICFLSACFFNESKYATGAGSGVVIFFLLVNMLSQVSDKLDFMKYVNPITLFQAEELIAQNQNAYLGILILSVLAVCFFVTGIQIFKHKDLPL